MHVSVFNLVQKLQILLKNILYQGEFQKDHSNDSNTDTDIDDIIKMCKTANCRSVRITHDIFQTKQKHPFPSHEAKRQTGRKPATATKSDQSLRKIGKM